MSALTPWFSCAVKPVRAGWYEVTDDFKRRSKFKLTGNRRLFDGENWRGGWHSELVSIFGQHPSHKWRGLAADPKDAK